MNVREIDVAVAAYLRRTGKTQGQLAEEIGMSENSLSWKRRGVREFRLSEAARLAEVCGFSLDATVLAPK